MNRTGRKPGTGWMNPMNSGLWKKCAFGSLSKKVLNAVKPDAPCSSSKVVKRSILMGTGAGLSGDGGRVVGRRVFLEPGKPPPGEDGREDGPDPAGFHAERIEVARIV